ncbi:FAS1-like dehydratase domain-containing protein [Microbacterium aurum]
MTPPPQPEPGSIVDDVVLDVEAGKIREFARATRAEDAAHVDDEAAADRGHPARIATLTHSIAVGHLRDQAGFVERLGLDIRRVVVGEVSWRYERPLVAGDRLQATRRVVSDVSRDGSSGRLRLVTLETEFADQAGAVVATVREVLVERGERQA